MKRKYYIVEKYRRKGPFNIQELQKQGITKDSMIWSFELSDPIIASELDELSSLFTEQKPEEKPEEKAEEAETEEKKEEKKDDEEKPKENK